LRWQHWKARDEDNADLARLLHQIALRGPNDAIFGHLLPRVEASEQKIVRLFKKHVRRVHADASISSQEMLGHIVELMNDIDDVGTSETLGKLKAILSLYHLLFEHRESVWPALEGGKLEQLFAYCDELRTATQPRDRKIDSSLIDVVGASTRRLS